MKNTVFTITLCLFFITSIGYSQDRVINGSITTFKTYAVNNVSVYAKKSKNKVVSDSLGNFSITCNKKDALKFNAPGFKPQSIKIKNNDLLSVNLIYGNTNASYKNVLKGEHLRQETLDYCVKNLLGDNNNYDRMKSVFQVIQSIYPSAKIVTNQNRNAAILLEARGVNSAQSDRTALLVVDGIVVTEINSVNPVQIKTIKVLIGGNAAHWGTRGANGVIEIITKH